VTLFVFMKKCVDWTLEKAIAFLSFPFKTSVFVYQVAAHTVQRGQCIVKTEHSVIVKHS